MKAIVGTAPNLPWWRLQNMTNEEITAFNRKYLKEIKMSDDDKFPHLRMEDRAALKAAYDFESKLVCNIWNDAIEAAAKHFENTWVGPDVITAEIRKLKKRNERNVGI